jgi:hypothetical protein
MGVLKDWAAFTRFSDWCTRLTHVSTSRGIATLPSLAAIWAAKFSSTGGGVRFLNGVGAK